jgi:cytidylate kinase
MIVCISGLSGCGKNTVGAKVASKLKLRPVQMSFKDEAARRGMTLMQLQELAGKDRKLDVELDAAITKEAEKGNCVVMTWLGPWTVKNADLRVWLEVSEEERARRVAGRDRMSPEEARKHVHARDDDNRKRYKRYYGIDIDDRSIFDVVVNTGRFNPDQASEIIAEAAELLRPAKYELG